MNRSLSVHPRTFETALFAPDAANSPLSRAVVFLRQLWSLLRVWVALCVTALAAFCLGFTGPGYLPALSTRSDALGVIFLSTLLVYNLDGAADARRAGLGRTRVALHLTVSAATALGLVVLLAQLPWQCRLFVGGGALLCGAYALPLPLPGSAHCLKELPHLKGPFVGAAVGTAVVWVPLLCEPAPISWGLALLTSAVLALYCTANALLFDIPDVREDRRNKTPTLVVMRGITATRRTCVVLCVTGLAFLSFALTLHSSLFGTPFAGVGAQESRLGSFIGLSVLGLSLLGAALSVREETKVGTMAVWVDGALLVPLIFQRISALG